MWKGTIPIGRRSILTNSLPTPTLHSKHLSTLSPPPDPNPTTKRTKTQTNKLISLTLYRQLLKWCDGMGDVPIHHTPAIILEPPRIDATSLVRFSTLRAIESLSDSHTERDSLTHLLPPNSIVDNDKLLVPVTNVSQVRDVIKLVYALNTPMTDPEIVKQRINFAFNAMKTVNHFHELLTNRKERRERNHDRNGVRYSVGQVVQHKTGQWRGVITGWTFGEVEDSICENGGSNVGVRELSMGDSKEPVPVPVELDNDTNRQAGQVQYTVILDKGDAHRLTKTKQTIILWKHKVMEQDMELVDDPALKRIRSDWTRQMFHGYDRHSGRFIPNHVLTFEYPNDVTPHSTCHAASLQYKGSVKEAEHIATLIIEKVTELASHLKLVMSLDTTQDPTSSKPLFPSLALKFDTLPQTTNPFHTQTTSPSFHNSACHLTSLLSILRELSLFNLNRRISLQNSSKQLYPLGTVVQHTKYNFRGVIVGWHPYPMCDVSNWDGLQHIKGDVKSMPFYLVMPHQQDMVKLFGGNRSCRYVCDENLKKSKSKGVILNEELENDGWVLKTSIDTRGYIPPPTLKFQYGESFEEESEYRQCLDTMTTIVNTFLKDIASSASIDTTQEEELSLEKLFTLLQHVDNTNEADILEETITEIWQSPHTADLQCKLDNGTIELLNGTEQEALSIFDDIINNHDHSCLEAWSSKARCHYRLGQLEDCKKASLMVLSMEQRHLQALGMMGTVYFDAGNWKEAAMAFGKVLKLNPWSSASTQLSACLELMSVGKGSQTIMVERSDSVSEADTVDEKCQQGEQSEPV